MSNFISVSLVFVSVSVFLFLTQISLSFTLELNQSQFIKTCCALTEILSDNLKCINDEASGSVGAASGSASNQNRSSGSAAFPLNSTNFKEFFNLLAWQNIFVGFPDCHNILYEKLGEAGHSRSFSLANGTLIVTNVADGSIESLLSTDEYCLQKQMVAKSTNSSSDSEYSFVALICQKKEWRMIFHTILLLTSTFFLTLTIVHQLNSWKYYQILHNWLQFSYLTMTLLAFGCLAGLGVFRIIHIEDMLGLDTFEFGCAIIGNTMHFSFLSAFFWLSAINFDLWLVISCGRQRSRMGRKKSLIYAAIALGMPTLLTWQKDAFDFMFSEHNYKHKPSTMADSSYNYNPIYIQNTGTNSGPTCGFADKLPYLYGPIGILLLVNTLFFLATVIAAQKNTNRSLSCSTGDILASDSGNSKDSGKQWKMFLLFAKLFTLLGLTWVFELTCWALGTFAPNHNQLWLQVYLIADSVNFSQGIVIFIICVWQDNIWHRIRGKFNIGSQPCHPVQEGRRSGGCGTIQRQTVRAIREPIVEEPLTELYI